MAGRGRPKAPLILSDVERQTLLSWSRRDGAGEWQTGDRRYLAEGSMALLNRPNKSDEEVAQPALMAS
jgi:hypothetical protein